MKIKNYYVKDMYEAMIRIREELGNEAVIISKRQVTQKGIFGFLKPKMIEVTAAVEVKEVNEAEKMMSSKKTEQEALFRNEINEIKEVVKQLIETNHSSVNRIVEHNEDIYDIFRDMDLSKKIIEDFESYCKHNNIKKNDFNKIVLYEFLMNRFNNKLNIKMPDSKVLVLIGPTGVGKTTTIAKIASRESLVNHKNVGLITIDTYRIGAVEQLKIYANILDIPVEVVSSVDDLPIAINILRECDLILVDTSGSSYKNVNQLNELKYFLDQIKEKEVSLVISMTSKNTDFIQILKSYQHAEFDNIILTKFDETLSYGNVLNAFYLTDKPISYISMGQVVPDDLEYATRDVLFKYIWGEIKS
ncbi:MAG: flagellar biosynthesis protein FlhF [Clostridiales bacterium]|nr:flagellar biosynthesis protein FlhF [Clostridiales bacterium]